MKTCCSRPFWTDPGQQTNALALRTSLGLLSSAPYLQGRSSGWGGGGGEKKKKESTSPLGSLLRTALSVWQAGTTPTTVTEWLAKCAGPADGLSGEVCAHVGCGQQGRTSDLVVILTFPSNHLGPSLFTTAIVRGPSVSNTVNYSLEMIFLGSTHLFGSNKIKDVWSIRPYRRNQFL